MFEIDIPLLKSHYVRLVLLNENDNSGELKTISKQHFSLFITLSSHITTLTSYITTLTTSTNKTIGSSWFTKNSPDKGPKLNT